MEPARAFRCCRVNQPSIRFWAVTIASSRVPVTLTTDDRARGSLASGKWIVTAPFIHSGLDRPNDELNAFVGHGVSPLSVEK